MRRVRFRWVTVTFALFGFLVACGGSDSGDESKDAEGSKAYSSECLEQCHDKGESLEDCNAWCDGSSRDKPDIDQPGNFPDPPKGQGIPGTFGVRFKHNGVNREAILYVPPSYDVDGSAGFMLSFHGFGGSASEHLEQADMRALADRDGLLLAYPQGTLLGGSAHWNAALNTADNKSDADDLGFVRELASRVAGDYPFDPDRLYATGFSNGGMMAFALACYAGDLVSAIGVVSGQQLDDSDTCKPSRPTAVVMLHGTDDSVLPYEGADEGLSVRDALDFWVAHNETETSPDLTTDNDGDLTIEHLIYSGGSGGVSVEHYRYLGGEHVWFDNKFMGSNASQLVWDFVVDYDIEGAR